MATKQRRWLPWLLAVPAFLGLSGLLFLPVWLKQREQSIRHAVAEAKAAHIALTPAELYPPYTGDPANNASTYLPKLFALAKATPKDLRAAMDAKPEKLDYDFVRTAVTNSPEFYALAEQLSQVTVYAPAAPADLWDPKESDVDFGRFRSTVKWLLVRARLRAHDGDNEGSVKDIERAVRIGNQIGRAHV